MLCLCSFRGLMDPCQHLCERDHKTIPKASWNMLQLHHPVKQDEDENPGAVADVHQVFRRDVVWSTCLGRF